MTLDYRAEQPHDSIKRSPRPLRGLAMTDVARGAAVCQLFEASKMP